MTLIDGGANAIRGFNYQKAVITLIAINNFKKDNFQIYCENLEDIEVICDNFHTFIQAKNTDLTIQKMLKNEKNKDNTSIFFKNCSNKTTETYLNNRYKIITPETRFAKTDKNDLIAITKETLIEKTYTYSDTQKQKIINSLSSGFSDIKDKLEQSYISLTNFYDLPEAYRFLLGSMCEHGIRVDNSIGNMIINELFKLIEIKSEIKPCLKNPLNPQKCLDKDLLEGTFKNAQIIEAPETFWDIIKVNFTGKDRIKIEKERKRILSHHKSLKNSVIDTLGDFSTDWDNDIEAIHQFYDKVQHLGEKHPIYATLIEVIAEKMFKE